MITGSVATQSTIELDHNRPHKHNVMYAPSK